MRGIPDCLNRRYRELDELVNELSSSMSDQRSNLDIPGQNTQDPGIKLMCNFWNILKEAPDCNLPQAVHQRMCTTDESCTSCCIPAQHFTCYMARPTKKPTMKICCHESELASGRVTPVSVTPDGNAELPINKVLGHLKVAASFDKKCTERLNNLLTTEKLLKTQIEGLETKEKDGVILLKKADCMWSCMEDAYKKRIDQTNERQKILQKQLKEIEASVSKWRKNKKDLESQLDTLNKQTIQVKDKINQKKNDMKYLDMEIAGFKKRIEGNQKETIGTKNSLSNKKKASDAKIATISTQVTKLAADLKEERKRKQERDNEGAKYIKEAREELLKISCVLLQKKLENEDKIAEKEGVLLELNLLQETSKKCKEICKNKELKIGDEINKIDAEIAAFKTRCVQCHQCIDTTDVRKLCTDCPKCAGDRECIVEGDHCDADHSFYCVCQMVKRKFLDNVFDNMYTVLERQSKAGPGKAVAEAVMNCLKKSRNGKLNEETRKILQDFVLTTVKNNLNLTIVGGAVKTRCEMDAETYKQLMVCLKQVRATQPPKAEKGTNAKKDACLRWGGTSECHCPKGPKTCICTRKAPPPPNDPAPCPPPPQDKEDVGEKVQCPTKKDRACGVDCGMHQPSSITTEVVKWRPDPCQGPSCKFENMRAAQCILGPESLSTVTSQSYKSALPDMTLFDSQVSCECDASSSKKPCSCFGDSKQVKAEKSVKCYKDICPVIKEKWSNVSPNVKLTESDFNTEFYASDVQSAKIDNTKVTIDQNVRKPEEKIGYSSPIPHIMREEVPGSISDKSTVPITNFLNNTDMLTNSQSSKVKLSNIVSLTHTASGEYVIELDAKMISQINQKSTKDPVMFVGIKVTASGQRKLVFNPPLNMCLIRTLVKKTPSGSISLEVDKSMAKTLLPSNERIVDVEDGKSSAIIGKTQSRKTQIKNIGSNEQQSFYNKEEYGNTTEYSGSSCNRITIKSNSEYYITAPEKFKNKQQLSFEKDIEVVFDSKTQKEGTEPSFQPSSKILQHRDFSLSDLVNSDNEDIYKYRKELQKIYNEHTGSIKMRIHGQNGVLGFIKADVTKTSSGNVALDLINVSSIGEISSKNKNQPVLLKRSSLGTYTLFVARRRNIKAPNAVLRRTSSERVLVIMTPKVKSMSRSNITSHVVGTKPKLFKIRTKGSMCGDISLQKAVLKLTPSGNYILVLDKEFEVQHTNTIQKVFGIESESYVELSKIDSDTVVINFDRSNDDYFNNKNAVLVKSPSGHLKVYVNGPIYENLSKRISNAHQVKQRSLEELLLEPLARETKKLRDNCTKYGIKYVSETNLNEKIRIKFQLRDGLFAASSEIIKRTPSGEYAVLLSKESKKRFMNDSKNILAHSSPDRIPIETTDDGEITIFLNGESESKGQYGSLKITPSGNIYVLVQESVLQEITKNNSNKHFGIPDLGFEHMIKKIVNTENKFVATNCNAEADDGLCDASKCVCEKIRDKQKKKFCSGKEDKLKMLRKKCGISLKTKSSTNRCSTPRKRNVSPHIVIKPCNCNIGEIDLNRNKQCYYVFDSVCPLHKKTRYDTVSNEILEISGLCKNDKNRDSSDSCGENLDKPETHCESLQQSSKCIDWDSLTFLPPQLPPFLKHYSYS